ncbi:hypothetical protein H6G63_20330 [Leptolyngbya sp. FACHB-402]|nr:hypothetical protein [Leptolyngbya sp. FACHB-402]
MTISVLSAVSIQFVREASREQCPLELAATEPVQSFWRYFDTDSEADATGQCQEYAKRSTNKDVITSCSSCRDTEGLPECRAGYYCDITLRFLP